MIEKNYTEEINEKRDLLISKIEKFQEIITSIDNKISTIDGDNEVFSSPASCNYIDYIKKDIIKIKDFLLTTKDAIDYLGQCTENYSAIDAEIINRLSQIGDVK